MKITVYKHKICKTTSIIVCSIEMQIGYWQSSDIKRGVFFTMLINDHLGEMTFFVCRVKMH